MKTKVVPIVVVALLCLGALAAGFKLFDIYLGRNIDRLPGHDLDEWARTARTLELHPYVGWHMQANVKGNFRLGQLGFATDMDLAQPRPKSPNEVRIILIGGSGAQGWGATSTQQTMAVVLEKLLNDRSDGRTYRVINMAMGSSITYQNFIALNRWGHPLKPDLILSYSGVNDYTVPVIHEQSDVFYEFNKLNALAMAARGSEFPPQLAWLRDALPNLMTRTTIGYGIKVALYPDYFQKRARASYGASTGQPVEYLEPVEVSGANREKRYWRHANKLLDEVATPLFVHALLSIERDLGVPVMLVRQAVSASEFAVHTGFGLRPDFYDRMFNTVRLQLPEMTFADFHAFNLKNPHPQVAVHLGDEGQAILARFVLDAMPLDRVTRAQSVRRPGTLH